MNLREIEAAFIAAKEANWANPSPEALAEVERWRSLVSSARNKNRNPESFVPAGEATTKIAKTGTKR